MEQGLKSSSHQPQQYSDQNGRTQSWTNYQDFRLLFIFYEFTYYIYLIHLMFGLFL
jgi:hypothetical protein